MVDKAAMEATSDASTISDNENEDVGPCSND